MKIAPIILAGGNGTRLWPLSRELTPKQLICLDGDESLLKQTIDRAKLLSSDTTYISTNEKLYNQIDLALKGDGIRYIIEPSSKNTAPAIALATKEVLKGGEDKIMLIFSADHHLVNNEFIPIMRKAIKVAEENNDIVLIGIKPARPETGFGYIKYIKDDKLPANKVASFCEKPDKETAQSFIASGDFLWNAGIFVAKASVLREELAKYIPELSKIFSTDNKNTTALFNKLDPISIDFGLLEKTKKISVIPADIIWNDLGSWGSIYDISSLDSNKNYLEGDVIDENTSGSLVLARGDRRIATIGIRDLVVIDTEDVTLICDRDSTQDVKKVVDKIKLDSTNKDHIEHKTMHRPWGRYTVLDEGKGFKVKFIHVNPGQKLSLQMHNHRSEHWVVVKGTATVTVGEDVITLNQNESTYVPVKTKHRLENKGDTELTIVEVASGEVIVEDDIVRFEDIYKRVS